MFAEWEQVLLFLEGPSPCSLAEASCSLSVQWASCHIQAEDHSLYHLHL